MSPKLRRSSIKQDPKLTVPLLLAKVLLFGSAAVLFLGEELAFVGLVGVLGAMFVFSVVERDQRDKVGLWLSGIIAAVWCFGEGLLFSSKANLVLGLGGPVAVLALVIFFSVARFDDTGISTKS